MLDTGTRRRPVALVALVIVAAAVVVAARSADRATVTDVLPIPDFGSVRADQLTNGTPVFIISTPAVGDDPPTLDVVQAFTPEIDGPVTGLVAWCSAASQFVDPHHGLLYDNRGRRLPSSLAGRADPTVTFGDHTALDDLIHRLVTDVEGRDDPGDPVVVEGIQSLQTWQVQQRPFFESSLPPASCRLPDPPLSQNDGEGEAGDGLVDGAAVGAALSATRTVDHSFLATTLDRKATGWQITDGWILVATDGQVQWCDRAPADGCDDPSEDRPAVGASFAFDPEEVGGVGTSIGGPLAVRLDDDGDIARVAVMADSRWIGSSLGGTEALQATLVAGATMTRPSIGLVDVSGDPASRCRTSASRITVPGPGGGNAQSALVISVDGNTTMDVRGESDPLGVASLDLLNDPPAVAVEIDDVTCQALAVTDASPPNPDLED